jgi:sugar lactone lactonase YvrE
MLLLVVALSAAYNCGATDIIQTIAGGGSLEGYKPDEANLALSRGLALGPLGDLFLSDSGHNQILKINPTTGLITVVAGNGSYCFFGDGLPAPSAALANPGALAFDAQGNLFIADRDNFRVRRVDALSGLISTVAGSGVQTDLNANPPVPLGDGGAATSATFGSVAALAVDSSGAIYVADGVNACIRKFTVGGTIATIAGTPGNSGFAGDNTSGGAAAAQFNSPNGVAVDTSGNVYIADSGNRRIRKLDTTSTVTTIGGDGTGGNNGFGGDGGPATSAQIGTQAGLRLDGNTLLICCVSPGRIRRIDFTSGMIFSVAGNGGTVIGDLGPATGAALSQPRDTVVDSGGNIYIYDSNNGRIRRVDKATGFIDTVIGTGLRGFVGDRGPNQNGVLGRPQGAIFDAAGNLFIADTENHAIRKVAADGTITTLAGNGTAGPNVGSGDGGPATLASLDSPADVTVVGSTLYICDTGHDRIRAVDLGSKTITTFVTLNNPVAIVADTAGNLYVARNNQIDKVAPDKTVTSYVGSNPVNTATNPNGDGLPAANARLSGPLGLALGPAGELYIADTGHDTIRLISAGGTMTSTIAGGGTTLGDGGAATSASLNNPAGVTVDASGTRLIISDTDNQRIRAVDLSTKIITTIAGTGTAGFAGDGDIAAAAQVNLPGKIFVNGPALVFADVDNNRIRKIVPAIDIDPKLLSFAAKLTFAIDKKTGEMALGKDSVALKAALALPAGIAAANLKIQVDIIDLHQQIQLDASGKMPKPVKPAKKTTLPPFAFTLPGNGPAPVSKFTLALKGTSVAGAKPTAFSFSSKGTFREELGRAGFSDVTTDKAGVTLPVRVNITLGTTTFTGLTNVLYKATQGKGGSAGSIKTK